MAQRALDLFPTFKFLKGTLKDIFVLCIVDQVNCADITKHAWTPAELLVLFLSKLNGVSHLDISVSQFYWNDPLNCSVLSVDVYKVIQSALLLSGDMNTFTVTALSFLLATIQQFISN